MTLQSAKIWEIAAAATLLAGAAAVGVWLSYRKRPTAEEVEEARRQFLTQSGRIVDGTVLEVRDVPAEDGSALSMLIYEYLIGGVDYECSQDITNMGHVVEVSQIHAGFPCSVRYQPGNPQNSIVVAEHWSGLRVKFPLMPSYDDPESPDAGHMS